MKRRAFLTAAAAVPTAAFAGPLAAIAQRPSVRVIIDNDFAGDPDGLVALAHQLLSPKARTVLVTGSALDANLARMAGVDTARTAAAGCRLTQDLIGRLEVANPPPVIAGAEGFAGGESAAARAIVAEALRDDALPLIVTCGGPLTNIAAALRLNPLIADKIKLVWIGGGDGGHEYNLSTDLAAARHVLEESRVPVWQIPESEYKRFQISVASLTSEFRTISPVAQWLYEQYQHLPPFVQLGGSLTFGDSPMVSLTAFGMELCPTTKRRVRRILDDSRYGDEIAAREIHVCHSMDVALNFADFFALLRLHRQG
ncbi:Inosine-uridine preferring nucleoside hydrolase [Duganella sp. CF402]|uniref:nucleoside hydrolase n=1 Tax=unclassified Duganella TaxID=2636909 RepID=UPI0008D14A78|nr:MULTISPECIES: nucleoside hydrolase [unclassified Duganella]RZT11189.1 inosine-uridine preferring nucleoside hydrolase [Duganella sp. BK701]SEK77140.1 Inosine-uridine preferring nucleoside hydrolase [Duganella sp. CF402]